MSCWREKNIVQSSAAQPISDNPVSHTLYAPAGDKQKNGRISGSHLTSQFSVVILNIRDDVRKTLSSASVSPRYFHHQQPKNRFNVRYRCWCYPGALVSELMN